MTGICRRQQQVGPDARGTTLIVGLIVESCVDAGAAVESIAAILTGQRVIAVAPTHGIGVEASAIEDIVITIIAAI